MRKHIDKQRNNGYIVSVSQQNIGYKARKWFFIWGSGVILSIKLLHMRIIYDVASYVNIISNVMLHKIKVSVLGDFMSMFGFLKKKRNITIEMKGYVNGKEVQFQNDPVDDEPLKPLSYYQIIQSEIKPLEDVMVGFALASREQKIVNDKIAVLEAFKESYIALKSKCYDLGPEYIEYFYKNWETPKQKNGVKETYYQRFAKDLEKLKANKESLKSSEYHRELELHNLQKRVLVLLSKTPGMLQTDVYKCFDPSVRNDISEMLYFLDKQGTIRRTKKGNTYSIEVL